MRQFIVDEDFHPEVKGYAELVRCKNCVHSIPSSENFIICTAPHESVYTKYKPIDWFCKGGERKDGDGEMIGYNREPEKPNAIQKKWDKLKSKRSACPNCGSYRIHLCHSAYRIIHHFHLECWKCHWCSEPAYTIAGAIRKWNRRKGGDPDG